jgi:hypothetical protein
VLGLHCVNGSILQERRRWVVILTAERRFIRVQYVKVSFNVGISVDLWHTSPTVVPHRRGSISMSRSYDTCEEIPQKCHPRSLGLNLRSVGLDEGFNEQALLASLCEKCHPCLQTPGCQKPRFVLTSLYTDPDAIWDDLGFCPIRPFTLLSFCHLCACGAVRLPGPFSTDFYT